MIKPIQQNVSFKATIPNLQAGQEKHSVRGDYKSALNDVNAIRDNAVAASGANGKNLNKIA